MIIADIRSKCSIHSVSAGNVIVIPRERKLVRLYIQLKEIEVVGMQVDRSQITPEMILRAAQRIMSPYKIIYDYCEWWTAYQVGTDNTNHWRLLTARLLRLDSVWQAISMPMKGYSWQVMQSTLILQRPDRV